MYTNEHRLLSCHVSSFRNLRDMWCAFYICVCLFFCLSVNDNNKIILSIINLLFLGDNCGVKLILLYFICCNFFLHYQNMYKVDAFNRERVKRLYFNALMHMQFYQLFRFRSILFRFCRSNFSLALDIIEL